ncbi:MAG: thioredoxin family protein [Verrucomicrobiales bacterium]
MTPSLRGLCAAFFVVSVAGSLTATLHAAGEGWMNDWEAAKKQAAEQKKDLLIDFTGSDWCGWCIKLDKEVFSEDAFKAAAKDKYVLVALDFPQRKELPEAEREQNEKLQAAFAVEGFPTIFLADSEGRPFARTGYQPGGSEAYVKHLDELTGAKTKRNEALAAAAKEAGLEKAKALKQALDSLPDDLGILEAYAGVLEEIKSLDKEDTLGLAKAAANRKALSDLEQELQKLARGENRDDIPTRIDEFLKEHPMDGEDRQKVVFMKLMSVDQSNIEKADPILDAIVAIDANTQLGQQAAMIKERLAAARAAEAEKPKEEESSAPKKKPATKGDQSAE